MTETSRRSLILGIGASLIVAPAIVRASSLMKVKPLPVNQPMYWMGPNGFYALGLPTLKQEGGMTQFDQHGEWRPVQYQATSIVEFDGMVLMQRLSDEGKTKYQWRKEGT